MATRPEILNHPSNDKRETIIIINRLWDKITRNPEIEAKDSAWLNAEFRTSYYSALIFSNKKLSKKYLAVIFEPKKVLIQDYQEEREKQKNIKRFIAIDGNDIVGSSKLVLNGNIIKDGFENRLSETVLTPEEQKEFLKELDGSSADKEATKNLKRRTPKLSSQSNNN